ncbi:MAG: DUF2293 domain-containing protein [Beijerinckiaceae bacterium]
MTPAPTRRQAELRKALRELAPLTPYSESEPVLEQAAKITRTGVAAAPALWLALVAHVRHRFTSYDDLLREGYDRDAARFFVVEETEVKLRQWGCSRRIDTETEED